MDNVRLGRQSLTKKISFHQKNSRNYRTIEPQFDKEPTRKRITIHEHPIKKDSSCLLYLPHKPQRKARSTSKWQQKRFSEQKRRSNVGSEPQLATMQNYLNKNMQMIKFSVQKQREKLITKQKYKRSQQVRSLLDHRRGTSTSKLDARESTQRLQQPAKKQFRDVALNEVIVQGEQGTLEDVFLLGCKVFYRYLEEKDARIKQGEQISTSALKQIKSQLGIILAQSMSYFQTIARQVGELNSKNVMMRGLILAQQGNHNQAILYLSKVMERTQQNLFLLHLPGKELASSGGLHGQSSHVLALLAYISLGRAYQHTSNFLCAINLLSRCHKLISKYVSISVSVHKAYQTVQDEGRMKKKSYIYGLGQQQATTSKFKKYSHNHNYSSIELDKSKKRFESIKAQSIKAQSYIQHSTSLLRIQKVETFPLLKQPYASNQYSCYIVDMHLLLARLYIKTKSWQLAMQSYKQCIQHNPHKVESLLQLASLYFARGKHKQSLQWLQNCIQFWNKQHVQDHRWALDLAYLNYHKALILYQTGNMDQSYHCFHNIRNPQLASEVNYYKGMIKLKQYHQANQQTPQNIDAILMLFNAAISCFTSKQYLVKSYFQILLILILDKRDYYGAEYEANRYRKLMPITQQQMQSVGLSRISKIVDDQQWDRPGGSGLSWRADNYFSLIFDIIQFVINVLKMKIVPGIALMKEITLKIQSQQEEIQLKYGYYSKQITKLLLQFKFYAYYIMRQYELSLKYVNRLLQEPSLPSGILYTRSPLQHRLMTVNKLMLQSMILMGQGKHNYAMSKLTQIQNMMASQSPQYNALNSLMVINSFNQLKALCLMQLYCQLQQQNAANKQKEGDSDQTNKEILLSAQQLLRHCLISDKQNSLLYYLVSVMHYQLNQYQSSLKYIREALEYSDDHMIKHYFCKANTKFMLGRYQEAIKDYTNAVIVYKEQDKIEVQEEEYYDQKQSMYDQIYVNRAIAYLKLCFQLSKERNYTDNATLIANYKSKATQDLLKYFDALLQRNSIDFSPLLINRLLLLMHTDDPVQIIQIAKKLSPKKPLLSTTQTILIYYLTKQLNNCIHTMQLQLSTLNLAIQQTKPRKQPNNKNRKISLTFGKKDKDKKGQAELSRLKFDLKCLQALKKSSTKSEGALEEALISLLQLSEEIYKRKEGELAQMGNNMTSYTLQSLFSQVCGDIFKWSDILFFVGVIHCELGEYQTAIKYMQESYNQKKNSNTLISLQKYTLQVLKNEPEDCFFGQLQRLFENRVYCREQIQYNIGVCHLMAQQYKQAYQYLQDYPNFLVIIKKGLNSNQNEFILVDQPIDSSAHTPKSKNNKNNKRYSQEMSFEQHQGSEQQNSIDITPFPIHNRLCSIYQPKNINECHFHLSFCLPAIPLPTLGVFSSSQLQSGNNNLDQTFSNASSTQRINRDEQQQSKYVLPTEVDKMTFQSVIKHVNLMDLQMKPIAPWIKQNTSGVVFTQNMVMESVDLNSARVDKVKNETDKKKKERYAEGNDKK